MNTLPDDTESRRRWWLRGGADNAIWSVVDSSTRTPAARTVESLSTREAAANLARRFTRVTTEQRAGHLFELWHKHSFNLDAITKGASARAEVTTWTGEPTAPADLRIVDHGQLQVEVQAKLVGRPAAAARALAHPKYGGMQRLVAEDKIDRVDEVLDKALKRDSEGIYQADYADARAHLTDTVSHGDVHSTPVSSDEMHRAAENPRRWANRQVGASAGRQIGTAALTGAAMGAALSGLTEAATQATRVRAGETSAATAACTTAGAAARGAARSGALAGLGATVRVAISASGLPATYGGGLPGALASAVFGVAEAGVAFTRREVDAGEFAARSCESTLTAGLSWAGAALGQSMLPVPVVGALVGGFVGQVSATLIAQGLQLAIAAARADGEDEERIAALEVEVQAAIDTADLLNEAERALGLAYNAYITSAVTPLINDALHADTASGTDGAIPILAELAESIDGQPLFVTVEEFDAWMDDPLTSLTLDPNWASVPLRGSEAALDTRTNHRGRSESPVRSSGRNA